MHTLETKIQLCRLLSGVTSLQRSWEYVYKSRPQMWGCHTVQSISTSWIYSPTYKKANKIKKTHWLLHVLLFRMKLQTQLNTYRLPNFSYCNPFLFLFCFFFIHVLSMSHLPSPSNASGPFEQEFPFQIFSRCRNLLSGFY